MKYREIAAKTAGMYLFQISKINKAYNECIESHGKGIQKIKYSYKQKPINKDIMLGLFLQKNMSAKGFCCTILREQIGIQSYRIIQ